MLLVFKCDIARKIKKRVYSAVLSLHRDCTSTEGMGSGSSIYALHSLCRPSVGFSCAKKWCVRQPIWKKQRTSMATATHSPIKRVALKESLLCFVTQVILTNNSALLSRYEKSKRLH